MDNQLEFLYKQIKEKKISLQDAVVQIKEFELQDNFPTETLKISPPIEERKIVNYFKKMLASVINLPVNRIEADAPMEEYGIDSVMVVQLTNTLEKTFGSLPKTLFFEYQTIEALTGYFIERYHEQLISLLGIETKGAETFNHYGDGESILVTEPAKQSSSRRKHLRFATLRTEVQTEKNSEALDIAIIGISGRYPGAKNVQEFWQNLSQGTDSITEIPIDRWDHSLYFDADKNKLGKTYSKWGGFLDGVDQFDPLFFNISPREALIMDPQERLFLECAIATIEDAGYTRESLGRHQEFGLDGNVGVYVGVMYEEYQLYGAEEQIMGRPLALPGSAASIANRVSHLCNFHGPSMTLDTMCSSSLTAIHLACQSLQRDGCEVAIAGGVNVSIHPNKYLLLGQGKFVSSKGRCESFGEGGDGYVPGEGVGAVLLKPLDKAIADGDHIYGVIKGTAINHGGKTNGYSVPNPNAQASVIGRAFKDAGIDPRAISYIEAHGTGTSLGDPIEIAGLTKTFQQYTKAKQFCAIGSAKSNIGHCESAAGIAGVTKIIMQLKHGKIAPSLHSKTLNPNIDFSNTPFVVQQELTEWKRPVVEIDGQTREYPRIAGISAFGAGGSNAHIVIEEYVPIKQQRSSIEVTPLSPVIIILSAKNEERLTEQAQQLLTTVEAQQFSDNNLVDIAYTLQVGREAMEERLAIVVSSMQELEEKLQSFMAGQNGIEDLYRGQVKPNKETVAVFAADDDMKITIDAWISKRKYDKLLDLWVKGLSFNWQKLYGEFQPCRISLPTYPFARERYWILDIVRKADGITRKNSDVAFLHPLLHRNTSDLSKQQFSSTFTGQEIFLADHVVTGQKVLPGVAYLEMAREAVKQAAGELTEGLTTIRLKNVVWAPPVVVGAEPVQLHIGLFPEDKGEIAYEIYSDEDVMHSQGHAVLSAIQSAPILDIIALLAECTQSSINSLGRQGLEQLYVGQSQFLAKLSLPASATASLDQFVLHPSVMDATLQAVITVMDNEDHEALQPVALQEIDIFSKCTANMWAFIQYRNSSQVGNKAQNLDIMLCDEQGTVCVQMKGLSMQANSKVAIENTLVSAEPQHASAIKAEETLEMMTFEETWQEEALINKAAITIKTMVCFLSNQENQQAIREEMRKLDSQTQVVFISQGTTYQKESPEEYRIVRNDFDTYRKAFQSIEQEHFEVDAMLYLWELEDTSCIEDYTSHIYILQAMAAAKLPIKRLLSGAQFVNGLQRCYLESWIGFERSLGLFLPNTQMAVIYQEAAMKEDQERVMREWLKKLWTELQTDKMRSALYQGEKRYIYQVRSTLLQAGDSLLRTGGTYLITGGCGGLGLLFAKYFAQKYPVKLILTGRSPISADKQRKIKALEALGSQVAYVQADVCDARGMKAGLQVAQERFGKIHGVIHAAGIEGKENIFEKELGKFEQVIAPKIQGTLVLDKLLTEEPIDFMCYFSSSSAILGDFGACDYAVGNRFQMAYAHYRKEQGCPGKTVVINWPLWKDGGMSIGEQEDTKMYLKTSGQRLLEAEEGLNMFERILSQTNTQSLVMVGQPSHVHRFLGLVEQQVRSSTLEAVTVRTVAKGRRAEMKSLSVEQCVEWDLKEVISQILRISRDKLDREENLADFGFDSISLTELAKALTNHYGIEISPAVFFGHSTIDKLTHYLMTEHQATIDKIYLEEVVEEIVMPSVPATVAAPHRQRTIKSRFMSGNTTSYSQPIAIIGMSGRFPQARNIDELWTIIRDGRDVVQEISANRFMDVGLERNQWRCGWVPGVSEFDPLFFEISPKEAETMDPRQRLLLQEAWKALEDAGYGTKQIKTSKVGMFVGVEEGDYHQLVQDKGSITSNHNAILAARLSYFLNLNGPNMAINTACSSGLVATHQACLSLRNQECDTAIAAGVNLMLTPGGYIGMSQSGMLSKDGKCYAFDKRASGMVPGEAVAVVVLKTLSKAQADGDPIYAVIQGSGINYDGKTNGITAPSGVSQTQLLKNVYEQYKVNPEDIEYIVTHGTGTKLGDPIEINALYDAFKDHTYKQGYCALTSTKPNIGHTLAASGVVSLISLVQAFRHETIPASLHCEQENEYINWQKSPFYVNKKNKLWSSSNGKERIGAVSAFGMGGTNVHMVVQSYTEGHGKVSTKPPYYLLALSAKTPRALQEKIQDIIKLLENKNLDEMNLAEISYTLLEGRKHFEYRCSVVVQDCEVAVYTLKQAGSKEKLPNLFNGKVSRDFTGQKAIEQSAQDLLANSISLQDNKSKYQETLYALAEFYCQGYALAWGQLYGNAKPRRINLPTYPFEQEHYWVSVKSNKYLNSTSVKGQATVIHPLLHKNTSDLAKQQFSSTFTGQEFFLADHVVTGQKVLPGVAYLEMARKAVQQAAGVLIEDQITIRLKNVVWVQPIIIGEEPVQVHIGLFPEDKDEIAYEIYSDQNIVHSQGNAVLSAIKDTPILDIKAVQAKCNQGSLTATECYDTFKAMGLDYGPGYQGIKTVYIGEDQVLAKLALPFCVTGTQDQFILHPSLMDSALQSSIGLMMLAKDSNGKTSFKPALPFALEELEILGKCTTNMWALIRYAQGNKAGGKVQKLDIDVCNEQGYVCVRMKGFSARVLESEVGLKGTTSATQALMLEPGWKEQAVEEVITPAYDQHIVLLCETDKISRENIESNVLGVRCRVLQAEQVEIDKRFQSYAVQVFAEIKTILHSKPKGNVLVQIVTSFQGEQELFIGLAGLLKTAQLENPKFIGQLIQVGEDFSRIVDILTENSHSPVDRQIRYRGEKRLVAYWQEVPVVENANLPWKDHGIYLITGGAGGLGQIFANEIAHKVKDATVILTGRSPLSETKKTQLKELQALGIRVEYQEVDITQRQAVGDLLQSIQDKFGNLHGIIHGAGILLDNFIIKKTSEELQAVLAPKVTGLVNLDLASRELPLDFFILFSSTTGSLGNSGQADYSTANAFMDAYAQYRNVLVDASKRQGRTLSINWPLWKDGGMHIDGETVKMMGETTGMTPMQTSTGIQALYQGVASNKNQVMVMEGDVKRLRAVFLEHSARSEFIQVLPSTEEKIIVPAIVQDVLQEKAVHYFKKLLSSVINLPANKIEGDAPLETYGIDSIMIMQLTNQLEKVFGSLSKTLFFEYQNIETLTEYFLEAYREQLVGLLGIEEKAVRAVDNSTELIVVTESIKPSVSSRKHARFATLRTEVPIDNEPATLDIAIIGISGRYPGASNVQEFWQNLSQGTDSIIEIPKERWDHSLYFDADKNKLGKTYSKWGGFIDGVDQFDPLFFNISPREAEFMDPQERLFLECAIATIEDAGYTRESLGVNQKFGLNGNVGVYVGVMYEEYQLYGAQAQIMGIPIALPGNPASIANRVSHLCNFHGPSMTLDTMCSSSLTAIHLACQSLQRDGCEVAIAGGVNVSIHPNKYLLLGQGKFVSSKGRCESFGEGGDGYVPGEGVGAVLLKPLPKAIADGDHIYGIIKGTAINHGGKTNGFSVPNPNAQASVIGRAINEAGIDPRAISYIEAHGTGTSLGDPIEIAGLTKTFQQYTKDKQFCVIGSAKSNIGHCESAAGIAGVTKIIMQLKHGQIAPSLHSRTLNPNIDFSNTPFVVQQELAEWKRPVVEIDGQSRECSRIAGISAFGAGGSNAHIVIEEYAPTKQQRSVIVVSAQNPVMIVLSAKNADRLKEQAQQLLTAMTQQQFAGSSLADMAYTLQVGREAMEERLAMTVGSIKELEEKLQGFVDGLDSIEELYRGQVKRNKETLSIFAADEDLQKAIEAWINKGKYGKLLDLWVKGLSFDWNKLYGTYKPSRMSLPTYPFAKERYWFPDIAQQPVDEKPTTSANCNLIHPLVQQNISSIFGLQFSSTFTGQEFFLTDHVVQGQRILPGVAYLEMARAAFEQATRGVEKQKNKGICLTNVAWIRPILVEEQPLQVHINLYPTDNGEIPYEICSEQNVVHSQGNAVLASRQNIPLLDLKALQAECTQADLTSVECYEAFKAMGIEYGPGHQGIKNVYVGTDQVLAELCLPASVIDTQNQFVLHPSLMDSALQATIGLMVLAQGTKDNTRIKPALPFALQKIEIIGRCTSDMWALIRYSAGSTATDKLQKLDIDLCDEQGSVCVRMIGFSSRVLEGEGVTSSILGTLMLEPGWQEQSVSHEQAVPVYEQQVVMLCELDEVFRESIESSLSGVRCLTLKAEQEEINKRFETYAVQVFAEIKTILQSKPKGQVLVQIVTKKQGEQEMFAGLVGLLKTAQLENPRLIGQLIEIGEDSSRIVEILTENSLRPVNQHIRYQGDKRLVAYWKEVEALETANLPWKDHGIYLITGGGGGLGQIFANEIAHKVKDVTLILTGRSPLSEDKKAQLKELENLGARVEYQEVDVTKQQAVSDLLDNIQEKFGSLNGIIHSAGVLRDNFILKKTPEELQAVLAPKVTGLVNLDLASKDLSLDFFILFSSISGSFGNVGQADYSTANAFMDAYARYRNILVDTNERQGQTLSINWPLWKEGGMHIDAETEKMMIKTIGMTAMSTATGIRALCQGLGFGRNQVMVLEGNVVKLRGFMGLDAIENVDNDFYQTLLEKVTNSELSTEQFEDLVMMRRGG